MSRRLSDASRAKENWLNIYIDNYQSKNKFDVFIPFHNCFNCTDTVFSRKLLDSAHLPALNWGKILSDNGMMKISTCNTVGF